MKGRFLMLVASIVLPIVSTAQHLRLRELISLKNRSFEYVEDTLTRMGWEYAKVETGYKSDLPIDTLLRVRWNHEAGGLNLGLIYSYSKKRIKGNTSSTDVEYITGDKEYVRQFMNDLVELGFAKTKTEPDKTVLIRFYASEKLKTGVAILEFLPTGEHRVLYNIYVNNNYLYYLRSRQN